MTHPFKNPADDVDIITFHLGIQTGLWRTLHQRSLRLSDQQGGDVADHARRDTWRAVELRFVWCMKSVAEVAYGMLLLQEELEAARRDGVSLRNVTVVRVKEGNHFVRTLASSSSRFASLILYLLGSLGLPRLGHARVRRSRGGSLSVHEFFYSRTEGGLCRCTKRSSESLDL